MIRCFIDNQEIDLVYESQIAISLSIASVTQVETGRTGYSKTIRVPMTVRNSSILGNAAEIHSPEMFNQTAHTARIEADGCTVIEGMPMISRCGQDADGSAWYLINILGAGKEWVRLAAERMFKEIDIPFETTLSASTVYQSWSWNKPVRFFPVQRDRFTLPSPTIQEGVRMLTFRDYHPFLHVRTLMESIAAQAGYSIRSDFMETDFVGSLYISGRYPEKETSLLTDRMGFLAKRFATVSAVADRFGRVYADPLTPLNSVGNLVDSADPEEVQDGQTLSGVYNHNNVFRKTDARAAFCPPEKVTAGFEYNLKYRSDYLIANRTELKCFNRICLDDDIERVFKVTNRYPDRRSEYKDNWGYLLVVFDHVSCSSYKFTYDRIINQNAEPDNLQPADYETQTLKTFDTRTTDIQTQLDANITNPQLWLLGTDGSYTLYQGDWALYDGYVSETGQIDITVTVQSGAREILPSQPHYFDLVYFGGADPGMKLTLSNDISLKPLFNPHPCEGTTVTFAEVAAHEIRQIEFVNALKQLFNLHFYTDTLSKTIYIEPREQFYTARIMDWSDKIDMSRPVTVAELGADLPQQFTLRYQPGDGSVARWDSANKEILGRWSAPILNRFAKEGEKTYYNPLFTPSLNQTGTYPDAPDATLLQAGDRDRQGGFPDTENLNFPAKIIRYTGIKTLPEGQYWGWPLYTAEYPQIAFHHTGTDPFTLCFEDRDGLPGLHTYYDSTIELYNNGKRITAYLDLTAEEVEPFMLPHSLIQDFRALFRLRINGENVLCRLEEIVDYQPQHTGPTKCIFVTNI